MRQIHSTGQIENELSATELANRAEQHIGQLVRMSAIYGKPKGDVSPRRKALVMKTSPSGELIEGLVP